MYLHVQQKNKNKTNDKNKQTHLPNNTIYKSENNKTNRNKLRMNKYVHTKWISNILHDWSVLIYISINISKYLSIGTYTK